MTILQSDIKLVASERMTDTTDGGGRRTSNVIPDGVAGNIFSKVSRSDSVYGRVNMRKVFTHVDSDNQDTYAGAHAAIVDAADTDKIVVNLFSTGSDFDDRTAARDRIESYVVAGPISRMMLWGRQLVGQQAISCMQRIEEVLPEVGEVYCLSKEVASVVQYQQYVRVEDVTHEVRVFSDDQGDYSRRIVTLKISTSLRYEFAGIDAPNRVSALERANLNCFVRGTTYANAAEYYGIQPVIGPIAKDALDITVGSIFSPIVPTTQRETPLSNVSLAGASQLQAAGLAALPARSVGAALLGSVPGGTVRTVTASLGAGVTPGSLSVYVQEIGGANASPSATDDGAGAILAGDAGSGTGYQIMGGTIDYAAGLINVEVKFANGLMNGQVFAAFIPAVEVSQPAHMNRMDVTLETRGSVLVRTLQPLPARGTVVVDFRAQNKWYRLRDQGDGTLSGGDSSIGTGTIDYLTGSLVATMGALPDVGSAVITSWGSPAHFSVRAGSQADAESFVRQKFTLTELPVKPGTLEVAIVAGTTTYTGTADSSGAISGGGITGTVNHATGEVEVRYSSWLPNVETSTTVTYDKEDPSTASPTSLTGTETFSDFEDPTFSVGAVIAAKGLRVKIPVMLPGDGGDPVITALLDAVDDGSGNLKTLPFAVNAGSVAWSHEGGTTVGTVDYDDGEVTLLPAADIPMRRPNYVAYWYLDGYGSWHNVSRTQHMQLGDFAWTVRTTASSTAEEVTQVVAQAEAPLTFDLTATVASAVVPNSVWFTAFGLLYFDRNGVIYHTMQSDGSGTEAGTIDYRSGRVTLTHYANNTALSATIRACLTRFGDFTAVGAVFRTAGSPLRAASTLVQAVAADGAVLTATTDADGDISGTFARGRVNQLMGIVEIEWGEMVAAAGNEEEDWYDESNVVGGNVWKPREVMPDTIRYSSVVLSNLPVNATLLGLDPVRLPSDGRVPIFKAGNVVLLHNTQSTVLDDPVEAGETYELGRGDLAAVYVVDANGARLPTSYYTADLEAGTVTMADPLDLEDFVEPLTVKHRIEELLLATDVQINGQIAVSAPVSRAFGAGSYLSSVLMFGDLFARVSNVFDQSVWTGVWQDTRIGDNGAAEYDTINHPIEIDNAGGVTDRWRIHFTSGSAFQVISENLGVIGTGSTSTDCSPINPLTGEPYFTLRAAGWGSGWSVGQQLRFNTYGASAPMWLIRTVLPGAPLTGDSIDLQVRGDVDI